MMALQESPLPSNRFSFPALNSSCTVDVVAIVDAWPLGKLLRPSKINLCDGLAQIPIVLNEPSCWLAKVKGTHLVRKSGLGRADTFFRITTVNNWNEQAPKSASSAQWISHTLLAGGRRVTRIPAKTTTMMGTTTATTISSQMGTMVLDSWTYMCMMEVSLTSKSLVLGVPKTP
ncbi:hypothetical protein OGAPHI_001124 [Ogataea philodendri]|uniref:Uncharacterized protein n=1 Tax=Ogataea philodendri TaxID=1378263 RepID=A0A9P8T9H9_9ASCO|nr:uncharacterized protein OGAPHI_001124 [Ogataea philodendri]KAH3670609.1 hypothetical protein OGAPHI_001124 [Ogataea philodendri]